MNECFFVFFMRSVFSKCLFVFIILIALVFSGCKTLNSQAVSSDSEKITSDSSEEHPFETLNSADPEVRRNSVAALGRITPVKNRYIDIYIKKLDHNDKDKTLKSISDIDGFLEITKPVIDALSTACRDIDTGVRYGAIESLQLIYNQLIKVIVPLNAIVTSIIEEDNKLLRPALKSVDETLRAAEYQIKDIVDTMSVAQYDPARSNRNLVDKFMYSAKGRPWAILQKKKVTAKKSFEEGVIETEEQSAKKISDSSARLSKKRYKDKHDSGETDMLSEVPPVIVEPLQTTKTPDVFSHDMDNVSSAVDMDISAAGDKDVPGTKSAGSVESTVAAAVPVVIPPFEALNSADPEVRKNGVNALGRITPVKNSYIDTYIKKLDHNDKDKTLKSISDIDGFLETTKPAIDALSAACRDTDTRVRYGAIESLQLIYNQLIKVIVPLNSIVVSVSEENNDILRPALQPVYETLKASEYQIQKILDTMSVAQYDPVRSNRNFVDKFMYSTKGRPWAILQKKDDVASEKPEEGVIAAEGQTTKKTPGPSARSSKQRYKDRHDSGGIDMLSEVPPVIVEPLQTTKTPDVFSHDRDNVSSAVDKDISAAGDKDVPGTKSTGSAESAVAVAVPAVIPPSDESKKEDTPEEITAEDRVVSVFLKRLESPSPSDRRFALASMTPFIREELSVVNESTGKVTKGDIAIRTEAAGTINGRARRMEDIVTALCRTSGDSDSEARVRALKNLSEILMPLCTVLVPFEAAPEEIEAALARENIDVEPLVRMRIEQFKRTTGEGKVVVSGLVEEAFPFLMKALDDSKIEVRNAACEGLKGILEASGEKDPLDPVWNVIFTKLEIKPVDVKVLILSNELESPRIDIARTAARKLTEMGPAAVNAVPSLVNVVKNKSNFHVHYKYVQMDAMAALGEIGEKADSAVPALIEKLDDIKFELRSSSALAIGKIGGKRGVEKIVDMLEKDKSAVVRESSAIALSSMDISDSPDMVYTALFKALKDPFSSIRMNAYSALAAQEQKNRALGIIRWRSAAKVPVNYRVCSSYENEKECLDVGEQTVFRLGDFKNAVRIGRKTEVFEVSDGKEKQLEFQFVDIVSVLEKSASAETDLSLKEKKNKVLLDLMKSLLAG